MHATTQMNAFVYVDTPHLSQVGPTPVSGGPSCMFACMHVCICVHTHHGSDISMSQVGFLLQRHHMFRSHFNLLHLPASKGTCTATFSRVYST